jgi:hypothetical protein
MLRIRLAVALALSVSLGAAAASAQVDPPEPDLDADGVADIRDACPDTPRDVAPLLGGCAPFEVFAAPPELLRGPHGLLDEALAAMGRNEALVNNEKKGRRALRLHELGLSLLRGGNPCGAAELQQRFDTKLARLEEQIEKRLVGLARKVAADPPSEHGDLPEGELPLLRVRLAQSMLARAATSLRADLRTLAGLCAAATPLHLRARIDSIDDASRRIVLKAGGC